MTKLRLVVLSVVVGGCGGSGERPRGDAGAEAPVVRRGQPLVAMTDERGVVRVGGTAVVDQSPVLVVDAVTQKPVAGALAEAVAEDEDDGYLVRLSKDAGGYQPEIVRVRRGHPRTVPMGPATADVPGRAVRVSARVSDDELLGEFELGEVMRLSEQHARPDVVFLPALPEGGPGAATRFAVYLAALPRTLLAVKIEGQRPGNATVVRGQARVVSMSGARRAGARVQPLQVAAAGEHQSGEERAAPLVSEIDVDTPDATGASLLRWQLNDPDGRVVGFEVSIDTTGPGRRLGKDVRQLGFAVNRGDHLACVRPLFAGADVDPVVRCLSFTADNAPPAANVRVSVRAGDPTATARRGAPVVVEVENLGATDAPGFAVDVVVSRDGRLEGGLGEVRTLWIDGVKAGGRTSRTTHVTPPRDGQLFVVARADGARVLRESNPEDNLDRLPITVQPAGSNRAPVVSMAGTALGPAAGMMMEGQAMRLRASADDAEDGDLTGGLSWWSSRDGLVGTGATLDVSRLSPGRHRIRAEVADRGLPAAAARPRAGLRAPAGVGNLAAPQASWHAAPEAPESAGAEMELEVLPRQQPAGNSPPRVSAGPDLTTTVGGEVSPRALASDPDGDALSYQWSASGPDGQPVTLVDAGSPVPRFIAEAAGLYRLAVKVSDGKAEERDDLLVRVLPANTNRAPKVQVMLPELARVNALVRANVMALDDDGDGLTLSYALDRPDGSGALLLEAHGLAPSFVPDVAGQYELTVTADDGRGGTATASDRLDVMPAGPTTDAGPPPADAGDRDAGVPDVDANRVTDAGAFDVTPSDTEPPPIADGGSRVDAFVAPDAGAPETPPAPDTQPAPDAPPPVSCDPVAQTGCSRTEDACYAFAGGSELACLLPGTHALFTGCSVHSDCPPGAGCFDGPNGRLCRPYCRLQGPECPGQAPACMMIGRSDYGACAAVMSPADAGVEAGSSQTSL